MTINLSNAATFMLVMFRMTGMLVFNPILGRRNIPTMLHAALAFILAIMLTGTVEPYPIQDPTIGPFLFAIAKELLVGLAAGILFQLFISVLVIGGEVIDMQLGISMAKAFDPGTNASISVTSSFLNVMFVMIFFVTNNHLTFIHMTALTFDILPVGQQLLSPGFLYYLPELFSSILIFAVKLSLPVVVIEVVVTMAVGIIMRIIPQINVFVVNIQFKLLIGIFTLIILVPSFTVFFENLILIAFERLGELWLQFV